jgi:hypothetical protein
MRPFIWLLAASLAANLVLGWKLAQGYSSSSAALPVAPATVAIRSAGVAVGGSKSSISGKVAAFSPTEVLDRLLALGLPRDVVRAVVRAAIEEPRLAREREFHAKAAALPWWRGGLASQDFTREQQHELNALRKAEHEELARVLGPEGSVPVADLERYDFLGAEKAAKLATLERDYADLRREAAEGAVGPERDERTRLLKAE